MNQSKSKSKQRVSVDFVITDFGNVRISISSLAWLESIDPEWREIAANKRKRGKHAKYVRDRVRRFEDAVSIAAIIAYHAGSRLREF